MSESTDLVKRAMQANYVRQLEGPRGMLATYGLDEEMLAPILSWWGPMFAKMVEAANPEDEEQLSQHLLIAALRGLGLGIQIEFERQAEKGGVSRGSLSA